MLHSPSCITAVITLLITLPLQTTASIVNWDLIYQSVDSHFAEGATDDITLTYMIGAQREYSIELYASDCETSITGMPILSMVPKISQDYELHPLHDQLDVVIDINFTEVTSSNIWDESNDTLKFCSVVHLLSGVEVIKEDKQGIDLLFNFTVDFNFDMKEVTADGLAPPDPPHIQVSIGFSIPFFGSRRRHLNLLNKLQAQSCQTLSNAETQIWKETITEILIADIDPSTTQLISVTITCITENTITFDAIFEEVCISESDAAALAQALVTDVETSLESSINDGTFVESLQDNAADIAASCTVDCETINEEIEKINNITNFGTPTVETQAFVFVSTISSILTTAYVDTSISACKCYSDTFECNTNALGPDDTLGICIKQMPSFSTDMELHDITNLSIDQAISNESIQIIQDHQPVNSDLSEMIDAGDVYFINTVVPARFFKSADSISVSGVVQVQFMSGTRRQLFGPPSVYDTTKSPATSSADTLDILHKIPPDDTTTRTTVQEREENSLLDRAEDAISRHPSGEPQVFMEEEEESPQEVQRGMSNNFGFRVGLMKPITTIPQQKVAATSRGDMTGARTSHILGVLCFFWTLCRRW